MLKQTIPSKKKSGEQKIKFKVFVVDDHPLVREGLKQLFNHCSDLIVCGEAEEYHKAMEAIETLKPDIVVADISLKGINGIELVKSIKAKFSKLPTLVLSMHDESLYAERALRAGARGYIMKHETSEYVVRAVRDILNGKIYVSDSISSKLLQQFGSNKAALTEPSVERLSNWELEVFQLIGNGFGTREIAKKLHRSIKTIETYRARIKEKLNLTTATDLVRFAVHWIHSQNNS